VSIGMRLITHCASSLRLPVAPGKSPPASSSLVSRISRRTRTASQMLHQAAVHEDIPAAYLAQNPALFETTAGAAACRPVDRAGTLDLPGRSSCPFLELSFPLVSG
jgi:hypothetical protein